MDSLREYILSVLCVAFLCGIIQLLFQNRKNSTVSFVAGLAITLCVAAPIINMNEINIDRYFEKMNFDSEQAVAAGMDMAASTTAALIKEDTEAYILERASELGAQIQVDIALNEQIPPSPNSITVEGNVSPYVKKQLSDAIEQELGISKDHQLWIS